MRILSDRGKLDPVTLKDRLDLAYDFHEDGDPKKKAAYQNVNIVIDYLEGRRSTI